MPPEQPLPLKCYRIYQVMWANNGDTISKQYAGTAALKVTPSFYLPTCYVCLISDWNKAEKTGTHSVDGIKMEL